MGVSRGPRVSPNQDRRATLPLIYPLRKVCNILPDHTLQVIQSGDLMLFTRWGSLRADGCCARAARCTACSRYRMCVLLPDHRREISLRKRQRLKKFLKGWTQLSPCLILSLSWALHQGMLIPQAYSSSSPRFGCSFHVPLFYIFAFSFSEP